MERLCHAKDLGACQTKTNGAHAAECRAELSVSKAVSGRSTTTTEHGIINGRMRMQGSVLSCTLPLSSVGENASCFT